jgi:hypothetical protein
MKWKKVSEDYSRANLRKGPQSFQRCWDVGIGHYYVQKIASKVIEFNVGRTSGRPRRKGKTWLPVQLLRGTTDGDIRNPHGEPI